MAESHTLVVVFLRGGMDGLNVVVPHFDDGYYRLRPSLSLAAPREGSSPDGLLPLDDRFALHGGLEALLPLYREGRLSVVHAIGSDDRTRSHFEAQDQMEHGASATRSLAGGWISRWMRSTDESGALGAMAFGTALPESLRGAPAACAIETLDDVGVRTRSGADKAFVQALAELHGPGPEPTALPARAHVRQLIRKGGRDALALIERLDAVRAAPQRGDPLPDTHLGRTLAQVARLIHCEVGLRVATLDHGGFDTHFGQPLTLEGRLRELGDALAAFDRTLGEARDRVTTVCVTEFGRRAYENASLGTDHGRASCAFVLGGGVRGGKVLGAWPGLGEDELEEPGDLRVTTDYRDLLWEVLAKRFGAQDHEAVFPGHEPRPVRAC